MLRKDVFFLVRTCGGCALPSGVDAYSPATPPVAATPGVINSKGSATSGAPKALAVGAGAPKGAVVGTVTAAAAELMEGALKREPVVEAYAACRRSVKAPRGTYEFEAVV